MNKRQVAKKLYRQMGDCWGVKCRDCPCDDSLCDEVMAYNSARDWLRANPEPKSKAWTNVLAAILFALCLVMINLLSGCTVDVTEIQNNYSDIVYAKRFSNIPLYRGDFSAIQSPYCVSYWMDQRVAYKRTKEVQSPEETLLRGLCDCDGYSLLYMNIMYVRFGIKCDLVLTDSTTDRRVVDGGHIDHAVVRLPSGICINTQSGAVYRGNIAFIYTFDEVFI